MNFDIPEYCDIYKNLIVEDLTFIEHPAKAHYGKCSVIGKIKKYDKSYYLESITIPLVDEKYRFPNGFTKILLIISNLNGETESDTTVEVFGEVISRNVFSHDILMATPKDLLVRLGNLQKQEEENLGLPIRDPTGTQDENLHPTVSEILIKEIDNLNNSYLTGIRAHYILPVKQPNELLECNLEIKLMRQNRK